MYVPPELDEVEVRVLRAIERKGMARGRELFRHAELKSPGDLIEPINKLLKYDLIDSAGDTYDEKDIAFAVFSVRPSAKSAVKYVIQQK